MMPIKGGAPAAKIMFEPDNAAKSLWFCNSVTSIDYQRVEKVEGKKRICNRAFVVCNRKSSWFWLQIFL
jgi:hypothetical protein